MAIVGPMQTFKKMHIGILAHGGGYFFYYTLFVLE